jgi:hypothetical protein
VRIYADRPPTALRQVLTDLLAIAWVYAWVRAAMWLHDLVSQLAVPGEKLEGAGNGIASNLADVGGKVDGIPFVGEELQDPFNRAAEAARAMAGAGADQQVFVGRLALAVAIGLVAFPIGIVLLGWLPARLRWMRRAAVATRVAAQPAGEDLLALRALATRPLDQLAKLGPDVAESWRRGDPSTVAALAALEMRDLGLKPPRP